MIKGIDINQRIEFVSKYDTDEVKTVFIFRPLKASEMMDVIGAEASVALKGNKIIDYLDMAICEIKNADFQDKRTFLDSLNSLIISELVTQASVLNNMTTQEIKNS